MTLEELKEKLPSSAKDTKLNLGIVLSEEGAPDLNIKQIAGVALASAYTTKNADLIATITEFSANILSEQEQESAKAAATIMAMNNVYYRFTHLVEDEEIVKLPAKLRMNIIANPGIAKTDFELICMAVSAINGCGMCMKSHLHEIAKGGLSKLAAQSAIRIASVINATAQALV